MEEIDLLNLVYDPSPLKKYLRNGTQIKNLASSSLRFHFQDGTILLPGPKGSNPLPWLPLFDHQEAHTLALENCNSECLFQLPNNIQTLTLCNYEDLGRVGSWLHAQNLPPQNRTLFYEGGYKDLVPTFQGKITEDLSHFLLPLNQDISILSAQNPHLRSFGFDFDHQQERDVLKREDLHFMLWTSSNHNHYLARTQHPRHEHRLYEQKEKGTVLPWFDQESYLSRL